MSNDFKKEDFCFRCLCFLVKETSLYFAFRIHKMSNTNRKTFKKKQNDLLHDTPGFMAVEFEDVKDSFKVKGYTLHAWM